MMQIRQQQKQAIPTGRGEHHIRNSEILRKQAFQSFAVYTLLSDKQTADKTFPGIIYSGTRQ
ncbi:hypothetical protein LG35_01350 [Alistipes inops]|uniref:Uncharacterized protein n=1 Tax=Alistipes inops TaxID=1501391 RepID=A0ABR4YKC4_9BACT|nr:hypothetical protein LG35_01350 [Alistipes inops]